MIAYVVLLVASIFICNCCEPVPHDKGEHNTPLDPRIHREVHRPLCDKPIPEMQSPFWFRLYFLWMDPLIRRSGKKVLEKSDIWMTPEYNRAGRITNEIESLYLENKVLVLAIYMCN